MAAPVKQLIDDLVSRHGQLNGKVGAAFSSSANTGGGSETTVVGILEAMLIAGMVVQGDPQGAHYGPISIGRPTRRSSSSAPAGPASRRADRAAVPVGTIPKVSREFGGMRFLRKIGHFLLTDGRSGIRFGPTST